jgi:hypothetical protein
VDIITEISPYSEELPSRIHGPQELKNSLRDLCEEYKDIFNKALNTIPADVEPLSVIYDKVGWERHANRLPARSMSTNKQQEVSA